MLWIRTETETEGRFQALWLKVRVNAILLNATTNIYGNKHDIKQNYYNEKSVTMFFSIRLCKSYDEISDKVQEMPDNTSDLVALTQFLENASSVTVVNLQTAVDEAGERLLFLLDYATLPCMLRHYSHCISWSWLIYHHCVITVFETCKSFIKPSLSLLSPPSLY